MLRRAALIVALGLAFAGCTSTEEVPEATPMENGAAPAPKPTPTAMAADAPPLGTPRAKIAPGSVAPDLPEGRATIR